MTKSLIRNKLWGEGFHLAHSLNKYSPLWQGRLGGLRERWLVPLYQQQEVESGDEVWWVYKYSVPTLQWPISISYQLRIKWLNVRSYGEHFLFKLQQNGPGEVAQQLKAPTVLPEDYGSVPSTNMVVLNHLPLQGIWLLLLNSVGSKDTCSIHMWAKHSCIKWK